MSTKTLEQAEGTGGGRVMPSLLGSGPHHVSSLSEVSDLVSEIQSQGAFAFDVETVGVLEHHPDLSSRVDQQVASHVEGLVVQNETNAKRSREAKEQAMTKTIALDPKRNEIIWIGLATNGRSWAIPVGHPCGEVLIPEDRGDGSTVPPTGHRKVLKSGQESMAKVRYAVPATFSAPPDQLNRTEVFNTLRPIFFDDTLIKIGHNVKFDARSVSKYYGEMPTGPLHDTMLAQHVLDENISSFRLTSLISETFDKHDPYARHGKVGAVISTTPFSVACEYVHLDARWTWLLYQNLMRRINRDTSLLNVFEQDTKVLSVLMSMEDAGMAIDANGLSLLGKELDAKMENTYTEIIASTYPGFNPDSVKDKRLFLFGKKSEGGLGLKPQKETEKGQASVDNEALKAISHRHKVIPLFLDWAEYKKLKSTYVDGLMEKVNNGRLHPNFHLHRTATGRLSSSDPNLQNVPRDTSVRGLFRADDGCHLVVADYDQIELRVMAMFSKDPNMMEIFTTGVDIHAGAAGLLFDKAPDEVSGEERQIGKAANFLTAYGGGAGKLSATTGITISKAKSIISQYYEQFSVLGKWKSLVVARAKRDGYVTTISGRRRRLPDINSSKDDLRSRAERQAVNAVVQGSASDICKKAMLKVHPAVSEFGGKVLVQVHDELVVSVPDKDQVDYYSEVVTEAMGHGITLHDVPLVVSAHSGSTWSEAKG